jgi:hypothetical protein
LCRSTNTAVSLRKEWLRAGAAYGACMPRSIWRRHSGRPSQFQENCGPVFRQELRENKEIECFTVSVKR